jgi:hypothetical protein
MENFSGYYGYSGYFEDIEMKEMETEMRRWSDERKIEIEMEMVYGCVKRVTENEVGALRSM